MDLVSSLHKRQASLFWLRALRPIIWLLSWGLGDSEGKQENNRQISPLRLRHYEKMGHTLWSQVHRVCKIMWMNQAERLVHVQACFRIHNAVNNLMLTERKCRLLLLEQLSQRQMSRLGFRQICAASKWEEHAFWKRFSRQVHCQASIHYAYHCANVENWEPS